MMYLVSMGGELTSMCPMVATLGEYLQHRLDELGWSQRELAARTEMKPSHVSQIVSGKIGLPNADIRRRLADALNVRHIDLLIAAGELADFEVSSPVAPSLDAALPVSDPRRPILAYIMALDPEDDGDVVEALQGIVHLASRRRLNSSMGKKR